MTEDPISERVQQQDAVTSSRQSPCCAPWQQPATAALTRLYRRPALSDRGGGAGRVSVEGR
jgi:hypothetical protein